MIPPIDSNLITIRHKLCRTTPFNASQIWQNTRITYLVAELLFVLLLLLLGSCFLLKANYEFVFVRLVFWCRLQSNEKKNTLNNRQLYDWLQMYDYVPDWTIQEWIIKYLRIEWKSILFLFFSSISYLNQNYVKLQRYTFERERILIIILKNQKVWGVGCVLHIL